MSRWSMTNLGEILQLSGNWSKRARMSQSIRNNSPKPGKYAYKGSVKVMIGHTCDKYIMANVFYHTLKMITCCHCLYGSNINSVGRPTWGWRMINVQ